jgi:peptidoglycan-associated lipoprotein
MIYKKIVIGLLTTLIFGGCSQAVPDISSNGSSNVNDTDTLNYPIVTIDEENSGANGVNSYSELNSINNPYNSSSNGFNSLYFDFDVYSISKNMQSVLNHDVKIAKQTSAKIRIEGNCDEFGTDEYNYALGLKRAKAVKDAMVFEGINPNRIIIFSYGESNPVCNNMSDKCYQRNRRVDLKLVR